MITVQYLARLDAVMGFQSMYRAGKTIKNNWIFHIIFLKQLTLMGFDEFSSGESIRGTSYSVTTIVRILTIKPGNIFNDI